MKKFFVMILLCLLFSNSLFAASDNSQVTLPQRTWSVLFYTGQMTKNTLGQVFGFGGKFNGEELYSLELGHELAPTNPVREFLQPLVGTVEVVLNGTYERDFSGPIYELNPMLMLRWQHFPWNKYLLTTLGFGEGVSYASSIPTREQSDSSTVSSRRLLNFLAFEATFGLPNYSSWELVARIHHRSGAFGLYDAGNSGSTAMAVGIRYLF